MELGTAFPNSRCCNIEVLTRKRETSPMHQAFQPIESAFVTVDGARLHYLHAGAGQPMLLIHGLVGSSANWRNSIGPLSQTASVYAIDQLRVAGLDTGLEATADRLAAAMDALGLRHADIVAHSHGGAVALMFGARHPGRVRRLILFAPANPWSHPADRLVRIFRTRPGRLFAGILPYLPARLQQTGLDRVYGDRARVPTGSLHGYVEDLRVPGTMRHILDIVRDWFAEMTKLQAALPRVADVPTLLLWGDCDRVVDPASAAQLQRVLPQSELHVVTGGGHILFEEFSQAMNRLMLHWLGRDSSSNLLAATDRRAPDLRSSELCAPCLPKPNKLQYSSLRLEPNVTSQLL
jgi:pimeloyl-ACP methyl ester carboxylesterase